MNFRKRFRRTSFTAETSDLATDSVNGLEEAVGLAATPGLLVRETHAGFTI